MVIILVLNPSSLFPCQCNAGAIGAQCLLRPYMNAPGVWCAGALAGSILNLRHKVSDNILAHCAHLKKAQIENSR